MPFWKKQIRELCKGFKFAQNPNIVEIRTIKQMLRSMDIRFFELQGINPRKPLTISGFPMPLQCEEDIERLELMVKRNPKIRQQYIEFLRCRKALSADISECFSNFFSDEAMVNYSWPMTDTCKMPRKQMNKYQIFTVCMLEAWQEHKVDMEQLSRELHRVILSINRRRYIIIPDNSPNEVVGFRFPLSCPEDIERLEFAVQTDATVRAQYINFLATKKSPEEGVSKCFEHVFSHLSLYNYCLFKQEATDSGKKLMTEYDIFTECMLEAWSSHGLTKGNLLYEQQLALDAALEHHLPKRAKDLGKLKQELLELDRTLDRGTVLRQRLQLGQVPGFNFPVATKQEVIRLEQAVVANRSVRHQYVRFLDTRLNESKMNVSKCLSLCFQNEALINFEWNRERNMRNDRVKIIGSFHIFTTCMRDAWKRYGITENIIEREIKRKLVLIKSNK